jgi:hypothetical protein
MRFVFVAHTIPVWVDFVVCQACLSLMVAVPLVHVYKRVQVQRLLQFIVMYGIGLLVLNILCVIIDDEWMLRFEKHFPPFARGGTRPVFHRPTALILYYGLGCLVGWIWCRCKHGRVVVQNGTTCPGCGYSLMGACRRLCSECGREFTYQELGTTEEEFNLKVATQGREARPIVAPDGEQGLQSKPQSASSSTPAKAK